MEVEPKIDIITGGSSSRHVEINLPGTRNANTFLVPAVAVAGVVSVMVGGTMGP